MVLCLCHTYPFHVLVCQFLVWMSMRIECMGKNSPLWSYRPMSDVAWYGSVKDNMVLNHMAFVLEYFWWCFWGYLVWVISMKRRKASKPSSIANLKPLFFSSNFFVDRIKGNWLLIAKVTLFFFALITASLRNLGCISVVSTLSSIVDFSC